MIKKRGQREAALSSGARFRFVRFLFTLCVVINVWVPQGAAPACTYIYIYIYICIYLFFLFIHIYKWHMCPGSYNKNPEEEQEEEVEEKK